MKNTDCWKNKEGNLVEIESMDEEYLVNTIIYIRKKLQSGLVTDNGKQAFLVQKMNKMKNKLCEKMTRELAEIV